MKAVFFAILFSATIFCAHSQITQTIPEDMTKPVDEKSLYLTLLKKPVPKTYLLTDKKFPYLSQMNESLPKTYLVVQEGSIYRSVLDNMPCVIPRISSLEKIPTLKMYVPDMKMPNPYAQSGIFPILDINKLWNTATD